jgi:hypothetical protein
VKVVSITEAPAEVAAQYDSTDKTYFVQTAAKIANFAGGAIAHLSSIAENVAAKLEDGSLVQTSVTGIGDACESKLSPERAGGCTGGGRDGLAVRAHLGQGWQEGCRGLHRSQGS